MTELEIALRNSLIKETKKREEEAKIMNMNNAKKYQEISTKNNGAKIVSNNKTFKENVDFIALGQCGGNIGKLFNDNGFNTIFVNSSLEDLNTLSGVKKYHMNNGEGAGKERKTAKKLLNDDIENVFDFIDANTKRKIVFLCCSASGGTGSGIAPSIANKLIDANEGIIVCPIVAIPNDEDCFQAKLNSYELFQELSGIKGLGTTFVINNNKSDDELYLNEIFYNLFLDFITLTDHITEKRNIDASELKKMLSAGGTTLVSSIDCKLGVDESSVFVDIKEHISPIENNKKLKYIAISLPDIECTLSFKALLKSVKKEFGEFGRSEFEGYNNRNKIITVLSGLSLPNKYINMYADEVQAQHAEVKKNFKKDTTLKRLNLDFDFDDEEEDDDDEDSAIDLLNS